MLLAFLFLCFTVYDAAPADAFAQGAQPSPPPAALQPAQSSTTPPSRNGVSDNSLTSPKGDERADERANLEATAKYAIDASREATETVKWVFGTAAAILTVGVGFFSWLGWKSLTNAIDSVTATANAKAMDAVKAVEVKAAEQLASAEKRMQEDISSCTLVCVNSMETVRSVLLGEQWADTSQGKLGHFHEALEYARLVQKYAINVKGLERASNWALGTEAYILDKLGDFNGAIAAQLQTISSATPEKVAKEYHYRFNLGCYYVKAGKLGESIEPLKQAIATGGEEARIAIWKEKELNPITSNSTYADRLQPQLGTEPMPVA